MVGSPTMRISLTSRRRSGSEPRPIPTSGFWEFANEFFAAFPVAWWSEKHDVEEAYDLYARYLKAYCEGVREANPNAIVMPDSTYNMNQAGGIVEKDHLLKACNKLGFKFDAIACHTYRPAPESPDLDTDMQSMLGLLGKYGYPEGKTGLYFSEGMHWGPYEIPALDAAMLTLGRTRQPRGPANRPSPMTSDRPSVAAPHGEHGAGWSH